MGFRSRVQRAALERQIVASCNELVERGLVISSTGNVSVRWGLGFVITPSRLPYRSLRRRHLVLVGSGGRTAGSGLPSRGVDLHAAIYRNRPDVQAIVHHHGPHATAWSLLERDLSQRLEEATYFGTGHVAVVKAATYGSAPLARECVHKLRTSKAVLLAGHGLIALGDCLTEAMAIAVAIEHEARVAWMVRHREASDRA